MKTFMITRTALMASLALAGATLITGCLDKDKDTPTVLYTDIVTCHINDDSSITFEQVLGDDNGSYLLFPAEPVTSKDITEGQRVLLQYSVNSQEGDSAYNINQYYVTSVRFDTISMVLPDSLAAYPNDAIRLNTRWRTGAYLNLDLSVDYYNKMHNLDLFYHPEQSQGDTLSVVLRHNRNNDAEGYWTQTYASFYIPELLLPQYKVLRIYANMQNDVLNFTNLTLRD